MKFSKKLLSVIIVVAFVLAQMTSCSSSKAPNDGKALIVTTSRPLMAIAEGMIDKNSASVICLLPAGTDGHEFDPTVNDISKVSSSAAFVCLGDELEAWAYDIASGAGDNVNTIDASQGIKLLISHEDSAVVSLDEENEHNHDHVHGADIHIWLSPANMLKIANTVYENLKNIENVTENGQKISIINEGAYDELISKLKTLDEECRNLAAIQKEKEIPLFFGDSFAFVYFMQEYGFDYVSAYPGCNESVEPSVSRISEVSALMKTYNAKVVFKAEMSGGEIAKSLAEVTDAQVLTLHSCHNLSKEEEKNGEDYFSLMEKNLENIRKALA